MSNSPKAPFFFYLGFLSQTFMIYKTAGEGGGNFFDSGLPVPPPSQKLRQVAEQLL